MYNNRMPNLPTELEQIVNRLQEIDQEREALMKRFDELDEMAQSIQDDMSLSDDEAVKRLNAILEKCRVIEEKMRAIYDEYNDLTARAEALMKEYDN